MRSYASRLSREEAELLKPASEGEKHTQPAPAPGVGAAACCSFGPRSYLATLSVMVVRVRELERRAGEDEGLARCDDVSSGGGQPAPPWPP